MHQVATLPLRFRDGRFEVCLITTRRTGRLSIPKGWPMKGKKDWQAAAIEAREEAGLVGKVCKEPLGSFHYWKMRPFSIRNIEVFVYRMDVAETRQHWPEMHERHVQWVPIDEAADMINDPELSE